MSATTDVLIVGAGPTGLTLAVILQERGVSYRLIDRLAAPQPNTRANTVMSRTFEVFGRLGVVDQAFARGVQLHESIIHRNGRPVASMSGPGSDESPYPYMFNLPQSRVEEVLGERLNALGGRVERRLELVDFVQGAAGVVADLAGPGGPERVSARFLVGADGAGSRVRKGLGLPLVGQTYDERFVVGDLTLRLHGPRDATRMWLNRDGFFLAWPHPAADFWHVVFNLTDDQDAAIAEPTAADVARILEQRSGLRGVAARDAVWLSKFRIHKRSAPRYRVGAVFLAGDAAHVHSPMAGMGMGNSIQDAYNLGWKLADVVAGRLDPALLDSYEEERRPVADRLTGFGDFSHRIFVARTPRLRFLRDRVLLPLLGSGLLQRVGGARAAGGDDYRISSLARLGGAKPPKQGRGPGRGRRRAGPPGPGDRAPDGPLGGPAEGAGNRLYDRFRGIRWTLLLFAGAGADAATVQRLGDLADAAIRAHAAGDSDGAGGGAGHDHADGRDRRHGHGHGDDHDHDLHVVLIVRGVGCPPAPVPTPDFPGAIAFDPTGALHRRYGADAGAAVLIRPDDYLAFRAPTDVADPLLAFLRRLPGAGVGGAAAVDTKTAAADRGMARVGAPADRASGAIEETA
jgi:2-polyprenyl-6-methoxyphenol hydroxylase-like FAD-dependent oxidoreductase